MLQKIPTLIAAIYKIYLPLFTSFANPWLVLSLADYIEILIVTIRSLTFAISQV